MIPFLPLGVKVLKTKHHWFVFKVNFLPCLHSTPLHGSRQVLMLISHVLLSMEPWASAKKKKKKKNLPAPVRVPSQKPLAPSVASVTSVANDKGDNEMILGLCTDLPAFALQLRKSPENLS